MRWIQMKEGYARKPLWINMDNVCSIKFSVGSDGQPMCYMTAADGEEVTTHDHDDLEKIKQVLQRNLC